MRRPLHGIVRDGRGYTGGPERQRVRMGLIVAQIALAVVLVTGSGLMIRSFQRLRSVETGIDPEGVLTVGVSLGENLDKTVAATRYERMIEAIAALPGVAKAGATNALPLSGNGLNGGSFRIESKPRPEGALPPVAMYAITAGDFFSSMSTPLVEGRNFESGDHRPNARVVIVNEKFAMS